jgi:hypothetical protein
MCVKFYGYWNYDNIETLAYIQQNLRKEDKGRVLSLTKPDVGSRIA